MSLLTINNELLLQNFGSNLTKGQEQLHQLGVPRLCDPDHSEAAVTIQRAQKIWHCGHGSKWGRPDGKEEKKKMEKHYEDGLEKNTCFIHHGHEDHCGCGYNTTKQMKNFKKHGKEGDVIFTHCVKKGGLTHYGFFTGKIIDEDNQTSIRSHICVCEWIPLPVVMKGVGRNCTLYEVTPKDKKGNDTKNFQHYNSIFGS